MTASHNSKDVGDETEIRVIHDLISSGYSVSIPFGDNDKYDLIVDDAGELHRILCETGWETQKGTIQFNTHSQTTRNGECHEQPYEDGIDAFVVRYPPNQTLYWIDADDASDREMELRFEADIDHPAINWAGNYVFDGAIPQ